jgi:hypothetical protein
MELKRDTLGTEKGHIRTEKRHAGCKGARIVQLMLKRRGYDYCIVK